MMILMMIFCYLNTLFISNHFTDVHSNFITIFQVSQLSIKSFFHTKIRQKVCFSQCFSHKNLVKGLPSLAALHRMSILTQRKTNFSKQNFRLLQRRSSRGNAFQFATMEKPNGTLRRHLPFDESFWRDLNRCSDLTKNIHTGDLFLVWHKMF